MPHRKPSKEPDPSAPARAEGGAEGERESGSPWVPTREDEVSTLALGEVVAEVEAPHALEPDVEAVHWLRARGVQAAPAELNALIVVAVQDLAAQLLLDSRRELPVAEQEMLEQAGFDLRSRTPHPDPVSEAVAANVALLGSALDVETAAEREGVSPARIRQRLVEEPRSLVGVRVDNTWRIPLFQFAPEGPLLPGLAQVLREISSSARPLTIQSWFLCKHVDLPQDEEEEHHFSPREWLLAGLDPARVAELAREV